MQKPAMPEKQTTPSALHGEDVEYKHTAIKLQKRNPFTNLNTWSECGCYQLHANGAVHAL